MSKRGCLKATNYFDLDASVNAKLSPRQDAAVLAQALSAAGSGAGRGIRKDLARVV